jgi:hypothetical protein
MSTLAAEMRFLEVGKSHVTHFLSVAVVGQPPVLQIIC